MRILLVEDETPIANFIRDGLREEGFAVDVADNGRTGLEMALGYLEEYDLFLLDWMLPGVSGIEICRQIRKENALVPIIMLTAKDTVDDTVFGLEAGTNHATGFPDRIRCSVCYRFSSSGPGHPAGKGGSHIQSLMDGRLHHHQPDAGVGRTGTPAGRSQPHFPPDH
ncbi:MAG: response regulator [Phaeodactylibacter sp.]|nr:response regulator [Phaeodactylibacter sp.]